MYGAIKAQFVDAVDKNFNIDGRDILVHYITIIDEDARSMDNRYVNLKIDNDAFPKTGLANLMKIKEFQGKIVQLDGFWVKESRTNKQTQQLEKPTWVFHVTTIKESSLEKKT
jgi:hypothetical protein